MLGVRGMMMPGNPLVANCHDPMYDPLWAAVDLALPLSSAACSSAIRNLSWLVPRPIWARGHFSCTVWTTLGSATVATPQDGWVAFKTNELYNVHRLMWANDFPHTPPGRKRRPFLARQTAYMTKAERDLARHDNVAELDGLERP
jgi:hypothetical protein